LTVEASGPAAAGARVTLYDAFAWRKPFRTLDCGATRPAAPADAGKTTKLPETTRVLLLGDDLLAGGTDAPGWQVLWKERDVFNLAAPGEHTQHVLWRLQESALDGLKPERVVLSVGGQNALAGDSPEEILSGVAAIVDDLHRRAPEAQVLVLGLVPPGADTPHHYESVNNALSSMLEERYYVRFYNLNYALLNADGTPNPELFAAPGRLNAKGYQVAGMELEPLMEHFSAEDP
jgi:lysophospholipase L1-like esterase